MTRAPSLTRREFLVATSAIGGGLALAIVPRLANATLDPPGPAELTPWLTISPDDIITIRAPGPEARRRASFPLRPGHRCSPCR